MPDTAKRRTGTEIRLTDVGYRERIITLRTFGDDRGSTQRAAMDSMR